MTVEEVLALVRELRDVARKLAIADPKLKAEVYRELGIKLTYDPKNRHVKATASPCSTACVGEGT
jgi:site-specific DNA recombinase